jgi:hypothetical protein
MIVAGVMALLLAQAAVALDPAAIAAQTTPESKAYEDCVLSNAPQLPKGVDSGAWSQALLTACAGPAEVWRKAMVEKSGPGARDGAGSADLAPIMIVLTQKMLDGAASQGARGEGALGSTGAVLRHAPPPDPDDRAARRRSVGGPCKGLVALTDPEALTCEPAH